MNAPTPQCKAFKHSSGAFRRARQCTNPATRDGFCGLHHPDTIAKRKERQAAEDRARIATNRARNARWDANQARLAMFDEPVEALRRARNYIDVSTIRPGKSVEAGWTAIAVRADEVLAKAKPLSERP